MKALVVYESMFGNTRTIATAVAEGLASTRADVEVSEVGVAPVEVGDDVDLLVVGAPTHAFGMSHPNTRTSALEHTDQPLVSPGIGLREWLDRVRARAGLAVAAFDTRTDQRWLPGSAARGAQRRLRRRGFQPVTGARNFHVTGMTGPLVDGEPDRAREWGERLASATSGHAASR
jgi:flavodoxin